MSTPGTRDILNGLETEVSSAQARWYESAANSGHVNHPLPGRQHSTAKKDRELRSDDDNWGSPGFKYAKCYRRESDRSCVQGSGARLAWSI